MPNNPIMVWVARLLGLSAAVGFLYSLAKGLGWISG